MLAQKKCDDAFALLSQAQGSAPPDNADRAAARELARGAEECRAEDPAVALGFSSLAARLAPKDAGVLVAHAEGLLAANQRGEAAAVLDRVIAENRADQAPKAWLARGSLAALEGDYALAVLRLEPLADNPELNAQVGPLLATSRTALKGEQEAEIQATKPGPEPAERSEARSQKPGAMIAAFPGEVSLGGQQVFHATGLKPGAMYAFRAVGKCWHVTRARTTWSSTGRRHRTYRRNATDIFGVDFRVLFNGAPSRQISAGQQGEEEENKIPFVADAAEVVIRVWDDGHVDADAKCTFSGFAVTAE